MLFTAQDIQKILTDVDFAVAKMVAETLGKDYLSAYDIAVLKRKGVDLLKLIPKFPTHYQSFLFGRVSAALGATAAAKITYPEFVAFMSKMGGLTPSSFDLAMYKVAANKTYTHIKNLGERIKNDVGASVASEQLVFVQAQERAKTEEAIHDEILDGVVEQRSVKKITANIANQMENWGRDWGRIVETEHQDVFNVGRATYFMSEDDDPLVYFDVFPGACKHCIRLFLTAGIGSKPKVFKLSTLLANGTNYGVKAQNWKATIHPVHPFCFNSTSTKIFTVDGWKRIADIKCGDFVLTHNNRFRKVLQTFKHEYDESEKIYNIEYEIKTRYGKTTKKLLKHITGNHPVLVNNKWVEVKNARIGDFLEIKGVECERCGELISIIPLRKNNLELCGSCVNSISAKEQFQKYSWIRKHNSECASKQMKERYKSMSKEDKRKLTLNARAKVKENHPEGYNWLIENRGKANSKNGQKRTFIEKKLTHFLEKLGVPYELGVFIPNNGKFENNVKGYFPDVFIPTLNIILEADGSKWHENKKEYDATRDCDLKREYGYDTFRFSEKEIREEGEKVYNRLALLVKNHSGKFQGIKAKITNIEEVKPFSKYLYNFAVEEDESYIADGVVVHNCRCDLRNVPKGYVWDDKKGEFVPPENFERTVPRKSKVKITIGEKEYLV